jgi:Tfp pilus assembly protein PilO
MKKLTAKKLFLVLLGLNALLVIATLAVFTLANSVAQQKSQKIAALKADNESNEEVLNNYKVLQNTLNSNKDLEATIQRVLPSDKDQSAAFANLDQFSKNTGVPIQQVTFNPGTAKAAGQTLTSPSGIKGVSVISVTLECQSTHYQNFLSFLKAIEMTQRRMQVTSVNITPNATNPDILDRVNLTVDIYLKAGS